MVLCSGAQPSSASAIGTASRSASAMGSGPLSG